MMDRRFLISDLVRQPLECLDASVKDLASVRDNGGIYQRVCDNAKSLLLAHQHVYSVLRGKLEGMAGKPEVLTALRGAANAVKASKDPKYEKEIRGYIAEIIGER